MLQLYRNIKERRIALGMSQDELARKTGYTSRSSIAKIESGKVDLPQTKIKLFAEALNTTQTELTGWESVNIFDGLNAIKPRTSFLIPVLGNVQAGIPIEAVQDILDYEEITPEMAAHGEYFALRVKGTSMEPRMREGDVVIVKQQPDVNHDDTAIVLVNGGEATIKRVLKSDAGIMLAPNNPAYETKFYSNKDIAELPVQIIGRVVELRAKF